MHSRESLTLAYHRTEFRPEDWLRFIELHSFAKRWSALDLDDDDLRALQVGIMTAPKNAPVIQATGGLRKIRFSTPKSNRGKSGAYRICYVFFETYSIVLLVVVFGKGEKDDLTPYDKQIIAKVIRETQDLLDSGSM